MSAHGTRSVPMARSASNPTPTPYTDPLQEHLYANLMSLLIINTNVPAQHTRHPQLWNMSANIASIARTHFGPDAEPKHVSIRAVTIRAPHTVQKRAQVVLHRGNAEGDKMLVEASCGGDTNLFTALLLETDRVCFQTMEALKVKERVEEEMLADAINGGQF